MTLQTAETVTPSIASAIALLNRMPVDARERVIAACSPQTLRGDASHTPIPFDAVHPPAGWRSICDVPPIEALSPIFTSSSWLSRYERGTDIQAYSATCTALKQLSLDLDRQIAKLGTCKVGRLEARLHDLGRQQYGGVRRDGHAYVQEPGFSSYEHMDRLKIATQPPGCPVRNSGFGLVVTMQRGWRQRQYDLRLNLALRPFRLTTLADSAEGRAACAAQCVPVERLVRLYRCDRATLQGADELLAVCPFKDGRRLATVMALVVIQAVAPELVPAELRKLVPRVGADADDPAVA